jgi:hypothetical protein
MTAVIRSCGRCGAGLLEGSNFCRWCGARHDGDLTAGLRSQTSLTFPHPIISPEQRPPVNLAYHTVSGPLVKAIGDNVSSTLKLQHQDRFVRGLIQALVSIPIWLMFILLSPFDAYAAAKNVIRGG